MIFQRCATNRHLGLRRPLSAPLLPWWLENLARRLCFAQCDVASRLGRPQQSTPHTVLCFSDLDNL